MQIELFIRSHFCSVIQSNLSIPDTLGPNKTVLIREVSSFQSVHNSRFDCMQKGAIQLIVLSPVAIAAKKINVLSKYEYTIIELNQLVE